MWQQIRRAICWNLLLTNSHSHTIEVETTRDHELADHELIIDVECKDTAEEK